MHTTNIGYNISRHHAAPSGGSPIGFGPALKPQAEIKLDNVQLENQAAADSEILAKFEELKEARYIETQLSDEAARVRSGLVARHGAIGPGGDVRIAWAGDPDLQRLQALNRTLDDIYLDIWEWADRLLEMPARTLPEMLVKLRIVAWQLTPLSEDMEYSEQRVIKTLSEFGALMGDAR